MININNFSRNQLYNNEFTDSKNRTFKIIHSQVVFEESPEERKLRISEDLYKALSYKN